MKNTDISMALYGERTGEFWTAMGPFFARRDEIKMPYLKDADDYVWFVAREGQTVVGFASLHLSGKGASVVANLHGLYVVPQLRGNGLAARLIAERLAYAKEQGATLARVTANANSLPALEAAGFAPVSSKGSYTIMEKSLV